MRTSIAFAVAAIAAFVSGCASTPTHYAAAADVPMYSSSEWTAMNTQSTVPEIPEGVGSAYDQSVGGAAGYTGYSLGFGGFDNYGSAFRSYGGGSAVHGAIASVSGHAAVSAASSGGHASSSGGGGHSGGHGGR